eukprot:CAMPEP_0197850318 /NCGR_PEP_ID=MMETSP1438-20131217/15019_1 /TAXON_ID=1461541 /ORGANISM="Pterosperma sp., Strain CCMP1384" /LENGTH=54 /DNA_ID=CAMNT_0043463427 /DNA_START=285 /DNA_END=449 /DNA_ORIENTATION=+
MNRAFVHQSKQESHMFQVIDVDVAEYTFKAYSGVPAAKAPIVGGFVWTKEAVAE